MGYPVFLSANYFNLRAFRTHAIQASHDDGNGFRVGTSRRTPLDALQGDEDTVLTVRVDLGESKPVDFFGLDRGHNLYGEQIQLQHSTDDFAADVTTAFSATLPAVGESGTDADLDDGVQTPEGAYLRRVTQVSARYWRLRVPAIAGIAPRVVGLFIGEAWQPGVPPWRPHAPEQEDVAFAEHTTPAGWRGAGQVARPRAGELTLKLESFTAYAAAERLFQRHYTARRAFWVVPDDERSEGAFLAVITPGEAGWRFDTDWAYRQQAIRYVEHEPRIA